MKKRNLKKRIKILGLCISLLLLTSILLAGGTAVAEKEKNMNEKIYTEKGTTEAYGGGDYYMVVFGTKKTGVDAAFGVIWGTKENPNSIIAFAIQARYLGIAQVHDENGNVVNKDHPMKIYTFYGLKLASMLEFNDSNGDGICNFIRKTDASWWESKWEHETIYNKIIDLSTAWTPSNVTTSENRTNQEKTWQFSLTANNMQYKKIKLIPPLDEGAIGNVLERLKFTFHLRARLVEVDNVTVPQFEITINNDTNENLIVSTKRLENLTYRGKKAMYGIKWDHDIHGWDFNPTNENKSLLMEFWGIVGNYIPPKTGHWFRAEFMKRLGEDGKARYQNKNGETENSTGEDSEPEGPRLVRANRIEFEGNWSKIGRFTWVSNVTVDGQEKEMYTQVQAGVPFLMPGKQGRIYSGFALLGGFSYPGGDSIMHDPGIDGEMTYDITSTTEPENNLRPGLFILLVLVIVAIVAVVAYSRVRHGKGKKVEGYENTYDRYGTYQNGEQDWSSYYDRKR